MPEWGGARLIDYIRTKGRPILQIGATMLDAGHWHASEERLREYLRHVPVVVADNIDEFEYWHWREGSRAKRERLEAGDVPNLVPPFQSFWLEWRWFDPDIRRMGIKIGGCLVECHDVPAAERSGEERYQFQAMAFQLVNDEVYHAVWRAAAASNAAGELLDCWCGESPFVRGLIDDDDARHSYRMLAMGHLTNTLIAISFLNCRNVSLIPGPPPPPRLDKAQFRKTGKYFTRYKLIEITPMSRIIREATAGLPVEERRAAGLHIVRGHFKRYEERGLFGRHKGTFFWHQAARGARPEGEIKADYLIRLDGRKYS